MKDRLAPTNANQKHLFGTTQIFPAAAKPFPAAVLLIIAIGVACVSCKSFEKKVISGRYTSASTGEYMEFMENGGLVYSVKLDNILTSQPKGEPFIGKYTMAKSGRIQLILPSAHIGLINVRLSDDANRVFLENRVSGRVATLDLTGAASAK